MFFLSNRIVSLFVAALVVCLSAGCGIRPEERVVSTSPVPAVVAGEPVTPDIPEALPAAPARPAVAADELGVVPILQYHRIHAKPGPYDRSPAGFRKDLDRLYRLGYRPILLQDLLRGHVDLPAGRSPVVLTFDDADVTQFRYLPDGSLDPDCAVAILQEFERQHADWKSVATFYILPESAFGPAAQRAEKLRVLREEMGCEIGNHTVTHRSLRSLSDAAVQKEIGGAVERIQVLLPGTPVETIALPMGISPKNRVLLAEGVHDGQRYANNAVLLVGANPAPSPFDTGFNPMRLPRIQAVEGPMGITHWLDELKASGDRFISDGDPATVTVPAAKAERVDQYRIGERTLIVREAGEMQ